MESASKRLRISSPSSPMDSPVYIKVEAEEDQGEWNAETWAIFGDLYEYFSSTKEHCMALAHVDAEGVMMMDMQDESASEGEGFSQDNLHGDDRPSFVTHKDLLLPYLLLEDSYSSGSSDGERSPPFLLSSDEEEEEEDIYMHMDDKSNKGKKSSIVPSTSATKKRKGRPPTDPWKALQYHDQAVIPPPPSFEALTSAYGPANTIHPSLLAASNNASFKPSSYQVISPDGTSANDPYYVESDASSPDISNEASSEAEYSNEEEEDETVIQLGDTIHKIMHDVNMNPAHNLSPSTDHHGIFRECGMEDEGDKRVRLADFLAGNIDSLMALSTKVDISINDFRNSTLGAKVRQKLENLRTLKKAVELRLINEQQFEEKQQQFLDSFSFDLRKQPNQQGKRAQSARA